jgi:hypothetical protein
MEPAHRARVPRVETAMADVILKAANLDRKTRAAWDPAAAAAGVVVKAAVKVVGKADGDLNRSTFSQTNFIERR